MTLSDGQLPVRLRRGGFGWELELYTLAAIDRGVYRPKRSRIHGASEILRYFAEKQASGALRRATACLMRRFPNLQGEFVGVNGEWVLQAPPARALHLVRDLASLG